MWTVIHRVLELIFGPPTPPNCRRSLFPALQPEAMHAAWTLRQSACLVRVLARILSSMRALIGCHTAEQWAPGAKSGLIIGPKRCPMVGWQRRRPANQGLQLPARHFITGGERATTRCHSWIELHGAPLPAGLPRIAAADNGARDPRRSMRRFLKRCRHLEAFSSFLSFFLQLVLFPLSCP